MKEETISRFCRVVFWLVIWYFLDLALQDKIPFAGPVETIHRLCMDALTIPFWYAIWTTLWGIVAGFFVSIIVGTLLGYIAYMHEKFAFLLNPFMELLRYIPMISFTLVFIMWSHSSILAFETSTFLSLPIIYKQTVAALENGKGRRIKKIQELDQPFWIKVNLAYEPATMPEYITGCHRASNMCWKSGIIAQMLGGTSHSIGSALYTARDNVDMAAIFSWTIVIVICSIAFEYGVLALLSRRWLNRKTVSLDELLEQLEDEDIAL